ncbi:hypothetical protein NFI96_006415 [Prochilodus magdalenae]|nr:hypothetical protein NFI96_006415 [Prochilodus magdalenae]
MVRGADTVDSECRYEEVAGGCMCMKQKPTQTLADLLSEATVLYLFVFMVLSEDLLLLSELHSHAGFLSRMEENQTDQCLRSTCPGRSVSALYVFLYVCAAAVVLLTVCGNLLIIISVCHFKQLHTPTNMLVLSLAVSDFLVGVFVMPAALIWMIESCWVFSAVYCLCYILVSYFLTTTSIFNVALIAVDRYLALSNPFLYTNTVSVSTACIAALSNWFILLVYNVVLQYFSGHLASVVMCPGDCFLVLDEVWSLVDFLLTFVLPCAVIIILYTLVFIIARRHAAAIRELKAQTRVTDSLKSERKAATVLGILVSVFLGCLFPYFVYTVLGNVVEIEMGSFQKVLLLVYLNSTINPVIYALCYPWFRNEDLLLLSELHSHAGFLSRMEENQTDQCLRSTCPGRSVSALYVFLYVCAAAAVLLTVCGNLLIIISVCHFKQLHTPTNMLVLSLAVSDLLVGVCVMPVTLIWVIESCWVFRRVYCICYLLAAYFLTSTSIYNVALIAVDRYFALSNPFLYTNTVSVSAMCAVVLCDWSILLLYNIALQYVNLPFVDVIACPGDCFLLLDEAWSLVDLLLTFVLPFSVIIILYTLVFVIARRHAAAIRDLNAQTRKLTDSMKSERKAAKVLGILVSVFLACLFPYFVYTLLGNVIKLEFVTFQAVLILLYLNSAINPIIYALFYPWFRRNRPHEGGLRARRPVVGPVLTGQHRRARLAFAVEHQNWQIRHRRLALFTDERREEHYAAWNIIQHDWSGGGHRDEIFGPLVRPYTGAVGPGFFLVHHNARPHVARVCRQLLEDEGIDTVIPGPDLGGDPRTPSCT